MADQDFPKISPSTRTYSPGVFPETMFQALNGATTRIAYGNRATASKMSMGFKGLTDSEAMQIIKCYENVNGSWVGGIRFWTDRGLAGIENGSNLYYQHRERDANLKWRFENPPQITTIYPGLHDVTCNFVSYLDA